MDESSAADDGRPLILAVDDNPANLMVAAGMLRREYRVETADNGEEALRRVSQGTAPDLILLDIMMPYMDGYEVCTRLKADPATAAIPIIFLTAMVGSAEESKGFEMGAADYLTKPLNAAVLKARVATHLALAAHLKAARRELADAGQHMERLSADRDRVEIERSRLHDRQRALLAITRSALGEQDLQRFLEHTLDALAAIPWLETEGGGGLFLTNLQGELVRVAERGMDEERREECTRLAPGSCACAQTAEPDGPLFFPVLEAPHCPRRWDDEGVGLHALPLVEDGRLIGVLGVVLRSGHQPVAGEDEFMADVAVAVTQLVVRRQTDAALRVNRLEVQQARNDMIHKLGIASEFRDTETGMHVLRMAKYAAAIAEAMGCDAETRERIEQAAPMHDVGKIGIEDAILRKPGKLTAEEFETMKAHTTIGASILGGNDPLIAAAREIALTHHEKWDGSGYPNGLAGEAIPLSGRICAVADVFDALTMERPYKRPWSEEDAVKLIEESAGGHFDPAVVAAFLSVLPEIRDIRVRYRDQTIDPREHLLAPPPREEVAAEWLPWDEQYSVGIDVIDVHHRYLLDWTNRLHRAVNARDGVDAVAEALFALEHYTHIHFTEEEQMLEANGYPKLEEHRMMHRSFEQVLAGFRAELRHNPFTPGVEMVEFLRDWLLSHIQHTDGEILALIGE